MVGVDGLRAISNYPEATTVILTNPPNELRAVRDRILVATLVAAVVAVWVLFLGLVDRLPAPSTSARQPASSPAMAVSRLSILFVVCRISGEGAGGGSGSEIGAAVPIATIAANGDVRPPAPAGGGESLERIEPFVKAYFPPGAQIRLLRGGKEAGTLRVQSVFASPGSPPVGRGPCEGVDLSQMPVGPTGEFALGASDGRLSSSESGIRPMRARDRVVAEALTRRLLAERYPAFQTIEDDLLRVRVVDLDRNGEPEIIASRELRARSSSGEVKVIALLVVAEPVAGETPTQSVAGRPYTITLAYVADGAAPTLPGALAHRYVDQVNLSPGPFDEIVVSSPAPDRSYVVLRREPDGWREICRTPAPF